MQTAMRCAGQNTARKTDIVAVAVQTGRDFIAEQDDLNITAAAHDKTAFAILRRFGSPELRQCTGWLGDFAERSANPLQHFIGIEFTGDQQHGIIRLVVHAIKRLQVFYLDVFDIAAITYRRIAIVVPVVGHALHALLQDIAG